jgi:hypothetical protein
MAMTGGKIFMAVTRYHASLEVVKQQSSSQKPVFRVFSLLGYSV